MIANPPNYKGRAPEEIISQNIYFDSVGYTYRALSWLDFARRNRNVCVLLYAALDGRLAIEQLLFEEVVLCVGTKLDRAEYNKIKGNSTKLHKVINKLNPDYRKLAKFTNAIMENIGLSITIWDHSLLLKHWGRISNLLHWGGEPSETVESKEWFEQAVNSIGKVMIYIWDNKTKSHTGIMMPNEMEPEIHKIWERYKDGKTDLQGVKISSKIIEPILRQGITIRSSGRS